LKGSKSLKILSYIFLFFASLSFVFFIVGFGGVRTTLLLSSIFCAAFGFGFSAAAMYMNKVQEHIDRSATQDKKTDKILAELLETQKKILAIQSATFKKNNSPQRKKTANA